MRINDNQLTTYYSKRSREYETIYKRKDPVRRKELIFIGSRIQRMFKDRLVLELACGTGYWTKYLLTSARKIVAIDTSSQMLHVASRRHERFQNIQFLLHDAYDPPYSIPPFNAVLACFWLSHVPKKQLKQFLQRLHVDLAPHSHVMFVDDIFHESVGGEVIKRTGSSDAWKRRILQHGETYDIIKNYYSREELLKIFKPLTRSLTVEYLQYYWIVNYTLV